MRLWILAHNSFGVVVTIAKLRTHSPAGRCQFSHTPASAMNAAVGAREVDDIFLDIVLISGDGGGSDTD